MGAAVAYRSGAIVSPEMVNVIGSRASQIGHTPDGPPGTPLITHLVARVWVKNVAYAKNVWADVHIYDVSGGLVGSGTYTLRYAHSADGGGDVFEMDEPVYRDSGSGSGSVRSRTDARRLQYRVYYEVNGRVYTDNLLHEHDVRGDEDARGDQGSRKG